MQEKLEKMEYIPTLLFSPLIFNAFRLKVAQITAVSIETAFQNGGIAFILLQLSLPKPYGDIAAVAPVRQFIYYTSVFSRFLKYP